MGGRGGSEATHFWPALNKIVLACRSIIVVFVKPYADVEYGLKYNFKVIEKRFLKILKKLIDLYTKYSWIKMGLPLVVAGLSQRKSQA